MFSIDITNRAPIYQQLEQNIIRFISVGVLAPNEQLPSVRNLAQELQINPNTVQKAYGSLEQKGLIYVVPGRGAFVTEKCEYIATLKSMLGDDLKWDYQSEYILGNAFLRVISLPEYLQASNPLFTKQSNDFIAVQFTANTSVTLPFGFEDKEFIYDNISDSQTVIQQVAPGIIRNQEFIAEFIKAFQQDMLENPPSVSNEDGHNSAIKVGRVGFYYAPKVTGEQLSALDELVLDQLLHSYSLREGENSLFEYRYFDIPTTYENTLKLLSSWATK